MLDTNPVIPFRCRVEEIKIAHEEFTRVSVVYWLSLRHISTTDGKIAIKRRWTDLSGKNFLDPREPIPWAMNSITRVGTGDNY